MADVNVRQYVAAPHEPERQRAEAAALATHFRVFRLFRGCTPFINCP